MFIHKGLVKYSRFHPDCGIIKYVLIKNEVDGYLLTHNNNILSEKREQQDSMFSVRYSPNY